MLFVRMEGGENGGRGEREISGDPGRARPPPPRGKGRRGEEMGAGEASSTGESFSAALFRAFSIVSSMLQTGDDVSSVDFFSTASPWPFILSLFPETIPGMMENLTRLVCNALPSPPQPLQGSVISRPEPLQDAQSFLTRCLKGPIISIII